jgi:hypothetical protein
VGDDTQHIPADCRTYVQKLAPSSRPRMFMHAGIHAHDHRRHHLTTLSLSRLDDHGTLVNSLVSVYSWSEIKHRRWLAQPA